MEFCCCFGIITGGLTVDPKFISGRVYSDLNNVHFSCICAYRAILIMFIKTIINCFVLP